MIHISDKAFAATDKYYLLGFTANQICKKLKEDGFPDLEIEAVRAVLNDEELSCVIDDVQKFEQ